MKRLFTIMLFAAMLLPWAVQSQAIMPSYTSRTGVDASKWITLDATATQLLGSDEDDSASPVTNIGFNFLFGEDYYSQFSVGSNGFLTLGPVAAGTSTTAGKFSSSTSFPKITGLGRDIGTCDNGYIKYKLVGTAPSRILVVEFKVGIEYSASNADALWQVQLHEDSNKVVLVYGATAPTTSPSSYQTGLGVSINDFLLINPSTHAITHYTASSSTSSSVWHGANRYYEFVAPVITCAKPASVTLSNITDLSVDVSWSEMGTATQWIVEYGAQGFTPGTGFSTTANDTSYSITGLTANTEYDVYVSSLCGVDDTSNRTKVSFRTACGLYDNTQLPLVESFETWTTAAAGDCFLKGHNGGSAVTTNYPSVSTSYAHDGSKSLYMYSTTAYASWVVFPEFTTPINQLQISFWMRSSSLTYPLIVAVVPDVANMNVFDTIAIVRCSATSVFEQFVFPLSLYQGNGGRLAFISPNGVTSSPYVDNVKIELLPPCPRPLNLSANGTGTETATVRWMSTGATTYQVEYDTVGFTRGQGIIETATGDSIELSGLLSGQYYYAYVRAYCGTDSSDWIGPVRFKTDCPVLTSDDMPYVESFENYVASSAVNAVIDPCWYRYNNISTTAIYPNVSGSYAATGSKSLYMNGTTGGHSIVSLPEIGEDLSNYQLSFKMYRASTSYVSPVMIGVMTNRDSISTFDTITIVSNQNNGVWEYFEIPLSAYNGSGTYISFATCPGIYTNCYIDDITISEVGTCPAPTALEVSNITTSSADITWIDGLNSSWIVEYGPTGFTLGTGTVEYASGNSVSLYNLNASSGYDVYVLAACADTNSHAAVISFRTECGQYLEIPFLDNFDSYGFGSAVRPQCWLYGGYNTSYPQISASQKSSGIASAYMYVYQPSTPVAGTTYWTYLIAPQVDVTSTPINTLRVRYKQKATSLSSYYPGTTVVGIVSDTSNIEGTFYPIDTLKSTEASIWEEFEVSLANYPTDSTGSYIVIASIPIGSASYFYNYVYVDDLKIDYIPSCTRPQSLEAVNTGNDVVTIQWFDEDVTHSAWDIAYGPVGFDPDDIDDSMIGAIANVTGFSGDTVAIQNLIPGTAYDFYIRTNCGGEYSEWRGPIIALPGSINIPASGMATITGCSVIVCDPGGIDDDYGNNANGYVVVYPGSVDSLVAIVGGNIHTESNYDYVKIYDGIGIGSEPLYSISGTAVISDTIRSTTGPLTIQFTSDGSGVYEGFTLMLSCVEAPQCSPVGNITVSNVGYRSAFLTWERLIETEDTPSFYLEVVDANGNVDPITTNDMFYFLSGLDVSSSYTVRIKNICGDNESAFDSISFTTLCWANVETDTITGATTSTSYYIPVNNFYRNTYSQQLVLASEMHGATTISGIQFEYAYSSAMTAKTDVSIYLHHTSATTLTSSAWDPTNNAQLVYTGSLNCSQGWNEFTFDSPFVYNGTSNLVITIVDLSNAYNSSTYTFRTHSATGKALYYQTDGSMSVPPSSRTAYNYRVNMKFMSCDNTVPITCPGPNVVVTNVEPNQVDVIWASNGSETSWNVEYRLAGDSTWTMAAAAYTNTSYSFTNLLSASDYQFRISALCGTENGITVVDVTTPCSEVSTYPFAENFDTWNTGSASEYGNICWGRLTNSSTRYPYVSSTYSMSPSRSVYMYAATSNYSALVLPKFDLPVDTLMISFGAYITSAAYQVQVGVMTDPEDIYSFTPIGVAHPSATYQWQPFEFNLSSYTGEDGYIAIVAAQGATSYLYVDNVEVYPIPSCLRPTNVTVDATSITTTSAVVTWTDSVASSWVVEYGPRGFVRGTGTTDFASSTSYTLTGLDHSTYYDIYVYAVCSAADTSYASFPVSFATLCGTMDFPFYEDFTGYQTGSSTSIPHFPLCWNGGGYSTSYPYISSGTGYEGVTTTYEYMYAYAAAADRGTKYTYLALPAIDSTMYQMSDLMVSFVTRAGTVSSTYDARLYVGVATNPTDPTTFVAVDTIERTTTDWVAISELELSSYAGTGKYIVFWICPQTASYTTFYLDEIEVDVIPTCYRPQDLHITGATATSVELAWTERNNATSWTIEYVPAGHAQGTGTTVAANSNPFSVTGLTATTQYDFYVKSNCSATDESRYTRKVSGWTSQVPAAVPYSYDFETAAEWNNWANSSNHDTVRWYRGSATAAQGTNSMYISKDGGATNSTESGIVNATTYRDFNFGANDTNFTVTFKAKAGGRIDGNYDGLMLYLVDPWLSAEASATGLNTPWGHVNNVPRVNGLFVRLDTVFDEYAVELDAVSGVKRLAFYYFNQTFVDSMFMGEPAAVDDINIVYTTCPRPTNVTATNLTPNSATITWGGSASGYYVYYRAEDQQTIDSIYTTSNTITLTNLTSNTSYLLAVKSICGSEMSIFSQTIQFYTPQILAQVPYYCGFEATESETSQWTLLNDGAVNNWCIGTATADSGSASLYVTNDLTNKPNAYTISSGSVSWAYRDFFLPSIADTANFEIVFRWKGMGEESYDFVNVYIGPATGIPTGGATTTITVPTGATLLRSDLQDEYDDYGAAYAYITESINLSGAQYGGGNYRIYFCWRNDGSVGEQPPISIDNFRIIAPEAACPTPTLTANVVNNNVTISWPEAGDYELKYRRVADVDFGQTISVTNATNYIINGLDPLTDYVCQVRRICGGDLGNSNWAEVTFTTEDLPCGIPTNIAASNITYTSATISWIDPNGTQTSWNVEYSFGGNTQTVTANTNSVELTGLYAGTAYNVRVQGICSADVVSEWSEVYTFSTATCQTVSNVTATEVGGTRATITWTPLAGQTKWEVRYGMIGTNEENCTPVIVEGNPTCTIEGLETEITYDVYVRNICGDDIYSAWTTKYQFTTTVGINTASNDNVSVQIYPNPANTEATVSVDGIEGKVEFVVADMNGRMIVTETINCEGSLVKTIDVSNLAKGAYFVHIYNSNFNTTRKLVVK